MYSTALHEFSFTVTRNTDLHDLLKIHDLLEKIDFQNEYESYSAFARTRKGMK